jgi:hypothetical protein
MHTTNTISDSGVIDHLMRPWGDETLSPCERTAYVIASLAIGLFTAFIFHIAYNIAYYLCRSENPPSQPLYNPSSPNLSIPSSPRVQTLPHQKRIPTSPVISRQEGATTSSFLDRQGTPPDLSPLPPFPETDSLVSPSLTGTDSQLPPLLISEPLDRKSSTSSSSLDRQVGTSPDLPLLSSLPKLRSLVPPSLTRDSQPPPLLISESLDHKPSASSWSFSYPSFSLDKRPEVIQYQRIAQEKLEVAPASRIPPLRVLAARVFIYRPETLPDTMMPFDTSDIFWSNTLPTFLADSSLSQKNVERALAKWPQTRHSETKKPGVKTIYLSGCTNLILNAEFLPHTLFVQINLNGVRLEEADSFVTHLCNQTHLGELTLDYDQPISQKTFCELLTNCRNLTNLQAGVSSLDSSLPPIESSLLYLRIAIPSLSESNLRSLFLAMPHLKGIIVHTKEVSNQLNITRILREAALESLSFISIVIDAPVYTKEKLFEGKTTIFFTYTDSATLFHDYKQARSTNFEQEAFFQLLNRYKHNANRLNLIMRKLAAQTSKYDHEKIEMFGRMFADRLTVLELESVFKLLEPFSLESSREAAEYNMNLEIFLRAGVEFCGTKTKEMCDYFDEKRTLILQFLQKHKEEFQLSILQSDF